MEEVEGNDENDSFAGDRTEIVEDSFDTYRIYGSEQNKSFIQI